MAGHALPGLSIVQLNDKIEAAEARLTNAVVATDISPNTANPGVKDIQLAIQRQFGPRALPLAITRFRSDFVIHFATPHERDLVASSEILEGRGFDALLVTWSNRYGGKVVEWCTEVSIDIAGFPPHTFDPSVLAPLLERHCSIQAYSFNEARGTCRVDAYALSAWSIPETGEIGLQYPATRGVCNIVFPVMMTAYNYHEAPEFPIDDVPAYPTSYNPSGSVTSIPADEETGVDSEMLEEFYERLRLDEEELAFAACHDHGWSSGPSSYGVSSNSNEFDYLLGDCSPGQSFESDRSWKLY